MTPFRTIVGIAVLVGISVAGPVRASTITYNYSRTVSTGTIGPGGSSTLSVPGSYSFTNAFSGGANGDTTIPTSPLPGFGFYDDYVFTILTAGVDAISSTISNSSSFQISNLQMRLYDAAGNSPLPVLGTPAGPTTNAVSTTTNLGGGVSVTYAVLPMTTLASGTYVLEVRGSATGTYGGSYSGVLNLTPVPLPGSFALLLSAFLALGYWIRGAGARRLPNLMSI